MITPDDILRKVATLDVSEEERLRLMHEPQGGSAWLRGRTFAMTGTRVSKALGRHNFARRGPDLPTSREELLREVAWGDRQEQNHYMWYGSAVESIGCNTYVNGRRAQRARVGVDFQFRNAGIIVHPWKPWYRYSPDGIVDEVGRGRSRHGLFEHKATAKLAERPESKPPRDRPDTHEDQIQFGLTVCDELPGQPYRRRDFVDYVNFSPSRIWVERAERRDEAFEMAINACIDRFFFQQLIPLLICRDRGWLKYPETQVPAGVLVLYADHERHIWQRKNEWLQSKHIPRSFPDRAPHLIIADDKRRPAAAAQLADDGAASDDAHRGPVRPEGGSV